MHKIKINKLVDSPLEFELYDESEEETSNNKKRRDDNEILNSFLDLSSSYKKDKGSTTKKKKKKDKKKKDKKKKKGKVMDLSSLDIFGEEKSEEEKQKMRESDDFYSKRFNTSLVLLTNLLKEVNDETVVTREYLDNMRSGRIKASPMSISSQTSNVISLAGTRLSIIKEITAVNSKISDLELKKIANDVKNDKGKDAETNNALIIDKMFDKIISQGSTLPNIDFEEEIEDNVDEPEDGKKKKKKKKGKPSGKSLEERLRELEESGDIEYTDSEKAFKYEKDGVQIVIYKNINNNRWKFVALNSEGDELYDYPLPNKKSIGKVKFDMETETATDGLNRTYKLIMVDAFEDDEYSIDGERSFDLDDEDYEDADYEDTDYEG